MNVTNVKSALSETLQKLIQDQHIQALEKTAEDQILNHLTGTISYFEERAIQSLKDIEAANKLAFVPPEAIAIAEPEPKPATPPAQPPAPPTAPPTPAPAPEPEPAGKV